MNYSFVHFKQLGPLLMASGPAAPLNAGPLLRYCWDACVLDGDADLRCWPCGTRQLNSYSCAAERQGRKSTSDRASLGYGTGIRKSGRNIMRISVWMVACSWVRGSIHQLQLLANEKEGVATELALVMSAVALTWNG